MSKQLYEKLCQETYVPVFSQPWWLDAVCGAENWDVFVVERSGTIFAALPYYIENRDGRRIITKAKNTQNNGILFKYPQNQKMATRIAFEMRIIDELIDCIENLGIDKYEQQFHYSFTNWLPFYWRGYNEMTRYTYVIEDTSNYDAVFNNYDTTLRNIIRKAGKFCFLSDDISKTEFYRVNRLSFERQKKGIPWDFAYFTRLFAACQANHTGKMLSAVDENGDILSVAYLVWDEQSVYYLLNGTDYERKNLQANAFLINESIKFAGQVGRKFDFEGSVIKPIEHSFRQFGGTPMRYFRIFKEYGSNGL